MAWWTLRRETDCCRTLLILCLRYPIFLNRSRQFFPRHLFRILERSWALPKTLLLWKNAIKNLMLNNTIYWVTRLFDLIFLYILTKNTGVLDFLSLPWTSTCPVGGIKVDDISNWGVKTTQKGMSRYDIKLHLIVRLKFWRSGECRVTASLALLPGSLWHGVVILRVSYTCKIDLFENY